jgi:hypothetical protein
MAEERPDNFKLPGGRLSYGEVKGFFGNEFADKAFDLMERIQAGEEGLTGDLLDLYFDYSAKTEGVDHIVLGPEPKRYMGGKDDG